MITSQEPPMPPDTEILKALAAIIRRVMDDPEVTITRETQAIDVKGWDSLSHTFLLIEVERSFKIRFPLDAMITLGNVGDLADMISRALAARHSK